MFYGLCKYSNKKLHAGEKVPTSSPKEYDAIQFIASRVSFVASTIAQQQQNQTSFEYWHCKWKSFEILFFIPSC
jgi:hypothetical protein